MDCRFYRAQLPEVDDTVMGKVVSIDDSGAYINVELVEYSNIPAMIIPSQLSRRRVYSIRQHVKVGGLEPFKVIGVSEESGPQICIDLSKRDLKPEEKDLFSKFYTKSSRFNSFIKRLAVCLETTVESIYDKFAWDLYDLDEYAHPFDLFVEIRNHPELGRHIPEEYRDVLVQEINKRIKLDTFKENVEVDITSFTAGIDGLKQIIQAGLDKGRKQSPDLQITLKSSPTWMIQAMGTSEDSLKRLLQAVCRAMKQAAQKLPGSVIKVTNEAQRQRFQL